MDHVRTSRRINAALGGRPDEMLCARAWREAPRLAALIDAIWWALWREAEHCRNAWHREHV